jgi:hypothetical protein
MFGGTNPDEIKISALMELVAEVRATSKDLGNSMKRQMIFENDIQKIRMQCKSYLTSVDLSTQWERF